MRVFVTGATGFIGSAVVRELIDAGHQVVGLARSDSSAKSLIAAGAEAIRGNIQDLASLRRGAAKADGAIHTAFFNAVGQMSLATRFRVFLGGSPGGIVGRFVGAAVETDRRAIETLGETLSGPDRPLVAAFATMGMKAGKLANEDEAYEPNSVGGPSSVSEEAMLTLAARGVRTSVIRLPPLVHGIGDRAGLAPRFIQIARKKRVSAYVGDGCNRWAAVHRLDVAQLFRLALEKGSPGARYHAVAEEGVPFRQVAELIGQRVNVPVISKTPEEAPKHFSFLSLFVGVDNPVSSHLTQERLGWNITQPGLLADLDQPGYFAA